MDWILISIVGLLLILGAVVLLAWKKRERKHETDYYAFFVMGLLWMVVGGVFMLFQDFEFNGLFAIGLIFFIMGLSNRDKWKKRKLAPGQEKMKIALTLVMSVSVVLGLVAYLYAAQPINYGELAVMGTVLVIVAFAVIIVLRKFRSMRAGLPSEDEMSRRITHKSGYYAFIASIWTTLGLSWADILWREDFGGAGFGVSELAAGVILITGLVFVLSFLYLSRSGNVD
jgi:hypothetical protein